MTEVRPAVRLTTLLLALVLVSAGTARGENVTLGWTAPGDDGMEGRAQLYDLRWSNIPITAANFSSAFQWLAVPLPAPAGTAETCTITGLGNGSTYYFALRTADSNLNWSPISNVLKIIIGPTADVATLVQRSTLGRAAPNPTRSNVSFALDMVEEADVRATVFDASGRRVRVIHQGTMAAGRGDLAWDLRDASGQRVPPGWYGVRAELGRQVIVQHVLVVR